MPYLREEDVARQGRKGSVVPVSNMKPDDRPCSARSNGSLFTLIG